LRSKRRNKCHNGMSEQIKRNNNRHNWKAIEGQ
jgi:hypothetical protein